MVLIHLIIPNILYTCGADWTAPYDSGYVFGNNTIGNTEFAQKYKVTGNANIIGTLVLVDNASSQAATALVSSKIYSENATTKKPNTVLGTSDNKTLNSFTQFSGNLLSFSTPVNISNSTFFASVIVPSTFAGANKDTLALLTTAWNCASTDSLSWIKNGSKWYSGKYYEGVNFDFAIFPIVNLGTNLSSVTKDGLSLRSPYPNPAKNAITINFSLNYDAKVQIELFDITGKSIKNSLQQNVKTGNNSITIDINDLQNGIYLYSISDGTSKIFSRFVVD